MSMNDDVLEYMFVNLYSLYSLAFPKGKGHFSLILEVFGGAFFGYDCFWSLL